MHRIDPLAGRKALARLPSFTQRFWTWLSALDLPGSAPRRHWTPLRHAVQTLVVLCLSAALGLASMHHLVESALQAWA